MGIEVKRNKNKTTFIRCPKNENYPFNRVPAKLYELDGYQFALMAHILCNKDTWTIVKAEIAKRVGFPRNKFNSAWNSLIALGYIIRERIQGGWNYIITEDPKFTTTTDGQCEDSTSTTGGCCTGSTLTTINNNYNNRVADTSGGLCEDDLFEELYNLYPSEGIKPDGTKYPLKGKRQDCLIKYSEYLKKNDLSHGEVIECLKIELQNKNMTGKTYYQPGLLKWIEGRLFLLYRGQQYDPNFVPYGCEMI